MVPAMEEIKAGTTGRMQGDRKLANPTMNAIRSDGGSVVLGPITKAKYVFNKGLPII